VTVIGRRAPVIAACCKAVGGRVDVDPTTGLVRVEPEASGMSPADEAALEWALRIAEVCGGSVVAVTAGPPAAERILTDALAAGAARAVRVELERDETSAVVAAGLARALVEAAVVFCGDASLDRGTGAVPAFLADALGAEQALGLVGLRLPEGPDAAGLALGVERRLDRGRREHLLVSPPCVLSVEAHTARLRRAPLGRVLSARAAKLERSMPGPTQLLSGDGGTTLLRTAPYRPRARVVPAPSASLPARDRVLSLVRPIGKRPPARTLRLAPQEAAVVLMETLEAWGELP